MGASARCPRWQHRRDLSQELPCVGDWVCVEKGPADDFGWIHRPLERRTALRRKSAGDSVEVQMIAANVDTGIIVQSCHYDFNLKRLEHYLVMVTDGGADACVLLT
jgi:ribosome biogenesis GTPase